MPTTISPANGAGILYTQHGTGTTPGYSAIDDRRVISGVQEGVQNGTDFMVVQRALGANLSVDIGVPTGGLAYVQGDSITGQGIYAIPVHSTLINEAIATADLVNPRVDSVILEVLDDVHDGGSSSLARTRVLTGTPGASTTLSNRIGAVALPASALLLADVLVAANATTIANSAIRDRRKFARGAYLQTADTAGNITLASIAGVASTYRLECSGAPFRAIVDGLFDTSAALQMTTSLLVDGSAVATPHTNKLYPSPAALSALDFRAVWEFTPAAGSHTFQFAAGQSGATITLRRAAGSALNYCFEELPRQNIASNSVTSG